MSEDCKGDLCQADRAAKGTDGVAPEGALQFDSCADAVKLFSDREAIMKLWDKWRASIAKGGGTDLPRLEFEGILDQADELMFAYLALKGCKCQNQIEEPGTGDEDDESLRDRVAKLTAALGDADRRAGEAEREKAYFVDSQIKRNQWLDLAKRDAGYDTLVSFDVVWAEALSALKAARSKAKIEERSDEVDAEDKSASLTQNQTKAQEIINWTISEGTKDFTALHSAIVSALTQSYQSGRQEERGHIERIVSGVMDECSVNMHKHFSREQDSSAEVFRCRLEGAARVAQKLGMLVPVTEEEATAIRKGEADE